MSEEEKERQCWRSANSRTGHEPGCECKLCEVLARQEWDVAEGELPRMVVPDPEPRYDEVFEEGRKWLDENG